MKDYWFYLYPETFLFIDEKKLLLYHSKKHIFLEVDTDPFFCDLYSKLVDINNFYCAEISKDNLLKYHDFISNVKDLGYGSLIQSTFEERLVSYPPICKINRDISFIRGDYKNRQAGYIIDLLQELTIYLTEDEEGSATFYQQTIYPIKGNNKIAQEDLLHLIDYFKEWSVYINIIGDPKLLHEYEPFLHCLEKQNHFVTLYFLNSKLSQTGEKFRIPKSVSVSIICDGDMDLIKNDSYNYLFPITNESELTDAIELVTSMSNAEIVPIYTGENLDFFRSFIFTSIEELHSWKITKREIFARQKLNTHFFRKLMILPNGAVYANPNSAPLGTIKDSLYEMIYKALDSDDSWMLTRDKKEPCSHCRFKFICPPISNYEFAVGQFDLCHLNVKTGRSFQ